MWCILWVGCNMGGSVMGGGIMVVLVWWMCDG